MENLSSIRREISKQARSLIQDFNDEVVALYRLGNTGKGSLAFDRWGNRAREFLQNNLPKEVPNFQKSLVTDRKPLKLTSDYENFMRIRGILILDYLEMLVEEIEKGLLDDQLIIAYKAEEPMSKKESTPKSAWANGLFYLFTFVTVISGLGFLANNVSLYTLALILVAAIIIVPLIGALQLRQDKNLSEKGMLELTSMVLRQLPLIGRLYKDK